MKYVTEDERIYLEDKDGNMLAEITFPTHDGVSTINHTFVDDSLRGQGVASQLVERAANKILTDGNLLAATCRYAVLWLQRHPEYPVSKHKSQV